MTKCDPKSVNNGCPSGYFCNFNRWCEQRKIQVEGKCRGDSNCAKNFKCFDGTCIWGPSCNGRHHCQTDEYCDRNMCVPLLGLGKKCTGEDCQEGLVCHKQVCRDPKEVESEEFKNNLLLAAGVGVTLVILVILVVFLIKLLKRKKKLQLPSAPFDTKDDPQAASAPLPIDPPPYTPSDVKSQDIEH